MFKDDKLEIYPIEFKNPSGQSCFSYVCKPNQWRGAFLPKKAKEFKGLIPKLHYRLLTEGESVTLEDGTIVTPNQVCEPSAPA